MALALFNSSLLQVDSNMLTFVKKAFNIEFTFNGNNISTCYSTNNILDLKEYKIKIKLNSTLIPKLADYDLVSKPLR